MKRKIVAGLILLVVSLPVLAQEQPSEADLKAANNPLATLTAANLQNYYKSDLIGLPNATANTAWLRFVKPVGRWLTRSSLAFNYVPTGLGTTASGMGDFNTFAAYLISKPTAVQMIGVGPLLVAPTTSNEALGSGKWQIGAAAVYFNLKSPKLQYGGLVTYQQSFAGSSNRPDTSLMILQPIAFWQLGNGLYLRGAPIWQFDLENETYNVPFGLGIGKIIKSGGTVFNLFIEPQFSMFNKGVGNPGFQLFAGVNLQFGGKGKKKG